MRKQILIFGHNDATQFIDIYNQYTALFNEKEFEITVAYLTGEPNEETKRRTLAKNVIFLNFSKKNIRTLKINAIRKMLVLCKEKQFAMVICHRYKPSYIMMWVSQFFKIPLLIYIMHELQTMASLNRKLLIACLARKNMLFAGVSNAVRDDMRKSLWYLPKDRIITLYNMIDVSLTEPHLLTREEARNALNIPQDIFVFGHIARLAHNKDQRNLIQALARIKSACPHVTLIIMGDGELEMELKKQVQAYGLNRHVIFTGFVSGASRYMKAFDCFVLSSIQEAFGRVLIEAMIAKLPIIATRVDGIPEVIGDAGILVDPHDSASLSEAMQQVYLTSPQHRQEMGHVAYRHVINHFSIPIFQQQFWGTIRSFYQSLYQENPS